MFTTHWNFSHGRIGRVFFSLAFLAVLTGRVSGETIDVAPALDTFVSNIGPDSNYSNLQYLIAGMRPGQQGPGIARSLIGFDLRGALPDGAHVESAVLRLFQSQTSPSPPRSVDVYRVLEFWDNLSTTWNHPPAANDSPAAQSVLSPETGWKEIDLTETVRGWLAGTYPNFGLMLRGDEGAASDRRFQSKEAQVNPPRLRITYGTLPAASDDNRGIEWVEVVRGSGGAQTIRVAWHGQAAEPHPQPASRRDFSSEIRVSVNGSLRYSIPQLLYYEPPEGAGAGVGCEDSYPDCGGACLGLWVFGAGSDSGGCPRHSDSRVEKCVCQSPSILADILAIEELKRGDLLDVLVVPKPWLNCPPFCPPDPEPWFVLDEFTADDAFTLVVEEPAPGPASFRRGDANGSGAADMADAIYALNYLFLGGGKPSCLKAADTNDNGTVDLTDSIYLLGFLFLGSARPPLPFDACGSDPSADDLNCEGFEACTGSGCPDPAAESIAFSIVSRTSSFAGRVRIAGVVQNLGAAFESTPGQQSAFLYELPQGGAPRLVARTDFEDLAPGAPVSVSYERSWDASSPAEGEFPPSYRLSISYDPDIYIDGNDGNDDCESGNNSLDRSGEEINELFN